MPTLPGLVLPGDRSLPEVLAPVADELPRCFWVADAQGGPLDSLWLFESDENDALVERLEWDVPAFRDTSTRGYRPGTVPRLARQFLVDEWSYYWAIDAAEPEALRRATALARHVGDFTEGFLERLSEVADLFVCHADGWWECFTARPDWHRRLREGITGCRERPLTLAGRSPAAVAGWP